MDINREQQIINVLENILKNMEHSLDELAFTKSVFRTTSYNITRLEIMDSINDTIRILIPAIAMINSKYNNECKDCN